eukprot:gnl/TRDRNA2_/TRDRNA2_72492_c0_seq1.p1 gnl/TRDRNA2_/TRDRNA2_72492_c0~~gnl/TRDRNA2_/TRDRNA2_72492_c0_seq1.p1  ORF type:complete len:115 (-),score=15.92 gnl/TRDRNA2_/TRDRNA2_72492_c0_seq1:32-376(-)
MLPDDEVCSCLAPSGIFGFAFVHRCAASRRFLHGLATMARCELPSSGAVAHDGGQPCMACQASPRLMFPWRRCHKHYEMQVVLDMAKQNSKCNCAAAGRQGFRFRLMHKVQLLF